MQVSEMHDGIFSFAACHRFPAARTALAIAEIVLTIKLLQHNSLRFFVNDALTICKHLSL
jgi:hypothetical protein